MREMFNVDEVFQMAQNIELAGARYYRDAAVKFAGRDLAGVLKGLARMEDEHFAEFGAIRDCVSRAVPPPDTWDPDGQAAQYLNALSAHKVFHPDDDPQQRFSGTENAREILDKAIGMEKDSILFYTGIKGLVPPNLGREQVDEIIRQEMGHVITLMQELKNLG